MPIKGRFAGRLTLVVSLVAIASCRSPYWQPEVHFAEGSPKSIVGVKEILDKPTTTQVDVITIHGMCTHDSLWANESINELAAQLGDNSNAVVKPIAVGKSNAQVFKRTIDYKGKQVNISALVWSPILTPLKSNLCYDQKIKTGLCATGDKKPSFLAKPIDSPAFEEERATANRLGKDKLMDDCLSDAVAYQGKARDQISKQVQEAILFAAIPTKAELGPDEVREAAAQRAGIPLVIFTSSLGSKVGFDALNTLRKNNGKDKAATSTTVIRTVNIFMAANQWPILQLADQELSEGLGTAALVSKPKDSLQELLDEYRDEMGIFQAGLLDAGEKHPPSIIVLSDPNDILSYSWRNSPVRPDYVTVDVVVSNDKTWFNLFENPGTAHQGYLEQPHIADMVMNGYREK